MHFVFSQFAVFAVGNVWHTRNGIHWLTTVKKVRIYGSFLCRRAKMFLCTAEVAVVQHRTFCPCRYSNASIITMNSPLHIKNLNYLNQINSKWYMDVKWRHTLYSHNALMCSNGGTHTSLTEGNSGLKEKSQCMQLTWLIFQTNLQLTQAGNSSSDPLLYGKYRPLTSNKQTQQTENRH